MGGGSSASLLDVSRFGSIQGTKEYTKRIISDYNEKFCQTLSDLDKKIEIANKEFKEKLEKVEPEEFNHFHPKNVIKRAIDEYNEAYKNALSIPVAGSYLPQYATLVSQASTQYKQAVDNAMSWYQKTQKDVIDRVQRDKQSSIDSLNKDLERRMREIDTQYGYKLRSIQDSYESLKREAEFYYDQNSHYVRCDSDRYSLEESYSSKIEDAERRRKYDMEGYDRDKLCDIESAQRNHINSMKMLEMGSQGDLRVHLDSITKTREKMIEEARTTYNATISSINSQQQVTIANLQKEKEEKEKKVREEIKEKMDILKKIEELEEKKANIEEIMEEFDIDIASDRDKSFSEYLFNFFVPTAEAAVLPTLLQLARHMASIGFSKAMRRKIIEKLPKNYFDRCDTLKLSKEAVGNKGFRLNRQDRDSLRIMKDGSQNKEYVKLSIDKEVIDIHGQPIRNVARSSAQLEAHIPLEDWLKWSSWRKP